MKSMQSRWMLGLLMALAGVPAAQAQEQNALARQYQPNLAMTDCQAAARAAAFLVRSQVRADGQALGWSWIAGERRVAPNLTGLVSLALLDAHAALDDEAALRAAWRYGEGLMESLSRPVAPGDRPPFKADVELLQRLGSLTGDRVYQDAARELWKRILAVSPTGGQEIARIAQGRAGVPALLGFDAALGIRAALALGERGYAFELADEVVRRSATWYLPAKDPRFSLVSAAALTPALAALDEARYRGVILRFRADLSRTQNENGSWLENETQPSAYAALALEASPRAEERAAAERGRAWLRSTMLQAGSFASFNDYMPEPFVGEVISAVHAEALAALSRACAEEGR